MNDQILLFVNGFAGQNSTLDKVMIFLGSYLVFVVFAVAAGCMIYLLSKREWRPVICFFSTLVVSFLLLLVASHLYVDNRPFVDHHVTQLIAHAAGKSFPSDHTTVATAIALGMLFFTRFKATGTLLLIAALLIGFARVFAGIHYPVDILGGLATGLAGALLVLIVSRIVAPKAKPTVSFDNPSH